jgi:hypothetical protein
MLQALMTKKNEGKVVCVHTILAYRGMEVLLCSFLTPPAVCQGKEPLVPLNGRPNLPQSQSGCYGGGINPLSLLRIE